MCAERDAVVNRLQLWRLLTHQLAFHQCVENALLQLLLYAYPVLTCGCIHV